MARKLTDDEYRELYGKLRYNDLLKRKLTYETKDTREGRYAVRDIAEQTCNTKIPSIADRDALLADLCVHWYLDIPKHNDDDGADWRRDVRYLNDRGPNVDTSFSDAMQAMRKKIDDQVLANMSSGSWFHKSWSCPDVYAADTIGATLTNDLTTTKETTMNTITVETRTFINGRDAKSFSDAEVYSLISQQEAKIAELNAITNKPQRLLDEVAKRQAGIDALVQYLNDKDAPAA